MSDDAVIPTKANFSDVGYDLSIIGLHSVLSKKTEPLRASTSYTPITTLYKTGIKLEIPLGYYVEIVPRSSISKSGYMLANSIGIIDCSYKGELLVALAKINEDADDIKFPFRCCQLIMRKQIYPELIAVQEVEATKRLEGGFGSS
jgi:dUTP pyrophosphatase